MQDSASLLIKCARICQVLICAVLCVGLLAVGLAYGEPAYVAISLVPAVVMMVCWRQLVHDSSGGGDSRQKQLSHCETMVSIYLIVIIVCLAINYVLDAWPALVFASVIVPPLLYEVFQILLLKRSDR